MPALFPSCLLYAQILSYIPAIPGKTQAAQSLSDTDPHMISPQCSKQELLQKR